MLSCSLCAKPFKCQANLNVHLLSHTKEKPHKCLICTAAFGLKSHLKNHIKSVHDGIKEIKKRTTQCPLCSYKCYSKTLLERHLPKHSAELPFSCDLPNCGFKTKYKFALVRHVREVHSDKCPFECPLEGCNYKGKSRGLLRSHLKIHSNEKPFACKLSGCKFTCKRKNYLSQHTSRARSDEKPFKCSICEFRAKVKCDLMEHQRIHMKTKRFHCQVPNCGFSTDQKDQVGRHFDAKHRRKKDIRCTEPGCNYRCASSSLLKRHLKDHKLPILKCPDGSCNYSTKVKICLLQHISSRHDDIQSASLVVPRKPDAITGGPNDTVERLLCQVPNCDYQTEFPHRFDRHLKTHEEAEHRKHVCTLCSSTFRTSSKLSVHIQRHTREKAYSCSYCDHTFGQGDTLRRHALRVHHIHLIPSCQKKEVLYMWKNLFKLQRASASFNGPFAARRSFRAASCPCCVKAL